MALGATGGLLTAERTRRCSHGASQGYTRCPFRESIRGYAATRRFVKCPLAKPPVVPDDTLLAGLSGHPSHSYFWCTPYSRCLYLYVERR